MNALIKVKTNGQIGLFQKRSTLPLEKVLPSTGRKKTDFDNCKCTRT